MGYFTQAKTHTDSAGRFAISLETLLVLLVGLVVIGVEIVHFVSLTTYPPLFIDESWNANTAWNWLQTGINFDSMHAGTLDQFGYEWLRWPVLGNAPWLASFALFGLGVFQLRLPSWIAGACLLLATIAVGRRSYSALTGVVAALLVAISLPFLQASHYARWDIMIAALAMSAFALVLEALETERWQKHLVAALLIGLSLDIHFNGILFAPGLAALYLLSYRQRIFMRSGTWLAALGGLLGIGYYVTVKILPNPEAYYALFQFSYAFTHKLPIAGFNPLEILSSLRAEIGRFHFYDNNLDFALIGASALYLARRQSTADQRLLLYLGCAFLSFVLFVGNKHDVYAILLYPFFLLMVAETFVSLIRNRQTATGQRLFIVALLALFLANSVMHTARPLITNRDYSYAEVARQIRERIPADARVMGRPEWWLGLADYDYHSNLNLTYYHFQNGYTLAEGFAAVHPDYLLIDTKWRRQLVDANAFPADPGFTVYDLPRDELNEFLAKYGTEVDGFYDTVHGSFEIWKLHWDPPVANSDNR
ncbi:MAG: glycosyltransferase family 39 protein [Caldilineaceae bacterium]